MTRSSESILARIARNSSLMMASKVVAALGGLFYLALAGHALGPEGLGLLVLVHSTTIGFREVAGFTSWQALIKYGAEYRAAEDLERLHSLLRVTVALDIGGSLVGAVLSTGFIYAFSQQLGLPPEFVPVALIYCISTLFALKSTPVGLLRLLGRFDLLARQALVVPLLRSAGVAMCWWLDAQLAAYLAVWFVADVVAALVLVGMGWRELKHFPMTSGMSWRWHAGDATRHDNLWPFVWSANLHTTVATANTHLPVILTGGLLTPAAAGFVKIGQEVAAVVAKPGQLLGDSTYPEISRLAFQPAGSNTRRLMIQFVGLGTALAVVLVAVIFGFGGWILVTLFGPGYEPAKGLLNWLAVAAGVRLATFAFEPLLYARGQPGFVFRVRLFAAIVQTGWLALAVGMIGVDGVGQAMAVGSCIGAVALGGRVLRNSRG